ncbi:MAG: hypothetical protein U5R06_02650 [candidate division KSB1 bacterium]|nr:hypothetical protein [candidate division KSB1 bacterium]
MRLYKYLLILFLPGALVRLAYPAVTIENLKGDVRVRRGMSETWESARQGEELDLMDTILTGEGRVVLERSDGLSFTLGSNSILDISELRSISRREMFLYVMSQKVQNIKTGDSTKLQNPNVSAVHGEEKSVHLGQTVDLEKWRLELNAARAMLDQALYPNSVIKCHKILNRYSDIQDCGTVSYTLARSFDQLDEPGQAIDHYQKAIAQSQSCQRSKEWEDKARQAIDRLSR